ALAKGIDLFKILKAACINPVKHYKLEVGLLRENDPADFIVVNNLQDFEVKQTYINGNLVAENGKTNIPFAESSLVNNFDTDLKKPEQFKMVTSEGEKVRVIEAFDGQLITHQLFENAKVENGNAVSDVENDVLKITVVNRYQNAEPAVAFIKNIGLKTGAFASYVVLDSLNFEVVVRIDESIFRSVHWVIL